VGASTFYTLKLEFRTIGSNRYMDFYLNNNLQGSFNITGLNFGGTYCAVGAYTGGSNSINYCRSFRIDQ